MLTPQELQIIQYGKTNGKSKEETLAALNKYRQTSQTATPIAEKPQEQAKPGLFSRISTDLQKRGENTNKAFESNQSFGSKALQLVGQGAGFAGDILTEGLKSASNESGFTDSVIKPTIEAVKPTALDILHTEVGQMGLQAVKGGIDTYNSFKQAHPEAAGNLEAVINIASILPPAKAAQVGGSLAVTGAQAAAKKTGSVLKTVGSGVSDTVGQTVKPENIMQRVARIPKGAQAKFEATSGEGVGKYLTKRGIYGDTEDISGQLFKRFNDSRTTADTALAKLDGVYNPPPLKSALKELVEREKRVSSDGALSPDYAKAHELLGKFNKGGLTMSEVNEAKRLFERNVKLDFQKQINPEGVARATNIDNALREWQFSQAEKLGLKNLPEINKETRLAKQLLDAIGKESAGSAGNNALTLTDYILLAGGDVTAISAFLGKKALSSKGVQSAIAKKLYKGTLVGQPKAEFGKPVVNPRVKQEGLKSFRKRNG